jgi:hypothetical protein
MVSFRLFMTLLFALLFSTAVHAQTTDFHMTLGASPDRNRPPVVMDMAWAREGDIALPEGRSLKIFVLWGDFGRRGQWLSRHLPRRVRAGKTFSLMYEDGRWQSLRPVGVRHGLEIPFAEEMARALPNNVVGVVVCTGTAEDVGALATEALARYSSPPIAIIQLWQSGSDVQPFDHDWLGRLDNPKLLLIDMTPHIRVAPSDLDWSESINDKGAAMAVHVLNNMKRSEEE